MFLPRTLEIKFGEEYSSVYYLTIRVLKYSSVYYLTIRVLLFYKMYRKSYKMISNKKIESCIMFDV